MGWDYNVLYSRHTGCFCAFLFFGWTWKNLLRAMVLQVCGVRSRKKSILPWKFRVLYIKLSACLLDFLFSWNRRHILTVWLLGFNFSFNCLHIFTACLICFLSLHCIYIRVTVCLIGVPFQRQCLHIRMSCLLGSISCQCLHIFTALLLGILFSTQYLHSLSLPALLVSSVGSAYAIFSLFTFLVSSSKLCSSIFLSLLVFLFTSSKFSASTSIYFFSD